MRNYVTFDNLERDAIELSKKCGGSEVFVEERPQKRSFLMNWLLIQLLKKQC